MILSIKDLVAVYKSTDDLELKDEILTMIVKLGERPDQVAKVITCKGGTR